MYKIPKNLKKIRKNENLKTFSAEKSVLSRKRCPTSNKLAGLQVVMGISA
jgi:hypothetical protein